MKTIVTAVVVAAVLGAAGSAWAGFEFAQSFAVGPGTDNEAIVTINPSSGTWDPAGTVDFSDNGLIPFINAVLDASWAPGTAGAKSPDGSGDLILWFGPINIPVGGLLRLTSAAVSEDGSSFTSQPFSDAIDSSWAGRAYRIEFDDLAIPPVDRDSIVAARFIFTSSTGVTFTVDGVSTPEPGTFALVGLGLVGIGGVGIRRRRRNARQS